MFQLSVAEASGIIAAAVHILQFILPNIIVLILPGVARSKYSAVTWSVIGRTVQSSSWPTILRTDSTALKGVARRITFLSWLQTSAWILLVAAAVVTPLGLYISVELSSSATFVNFLYVADNGPMGYGTPPRSDQGFSRRCGGFVPLPCPGVTMDFSMNRTNTSANIRYNSTYDIRVPYQLAELYQSGLTSQSPTMSSFFDLQSRQYGFVQVSPDDIDANNGSAYIVEFFRQVNSLVLNDAVEPFEGVIVDTEVGSLGFRNHTVPQTDGIAAEWTEEMLFLQPVTECVDLNVTIDFIDDGTDKSSQTIYLVDHGGFSNLTRHYPEFDVSDMQNTLVLKERAYKAAWLTNWFTMLFLNVTRPQPHALEYLNSYDGKQFPLRPGYTGGQSRLLTSSITFGDYLDTTFIADNYSDPITNYPNPFGIDSYNFSFIPGLCAGAYGSDIANSSTVAVACGQVFGVPKMQSSGHPLVSQPNMSWSQPLYACASAVKALIKVVHFKYNISSAATLENLSIVNITDKVYNNATELPTWGVEDTDMYLFDVNQLWGLVDEAYAKGNNISLFKKESIYLPGYSYIAPVTTTAGVDSMSGVNAPLFAMTAAYSIGTGAIAGLNSVSGLRDYTGITDTAMYAKWQALSQNASSVAQIIDLTWTDVATSALVGTRSWNSGNTLPSNLANSPSTEQKVTNTPLKVPVRIVAPRLRYHWVYAIPAFILLALTLCILIALLAYSIRGNISITNLRRYLNFTSAGRLLATKDEGIIALVDQEPTKHWIQSKGKTLLQIDHTPPVAIPLRKRTHKGLKSRSDQSLIPLITPDETFVLPPLALSPTDLSRFSYPGPSYS